MIETALTTFLMAAVGNNRVYPLVVPQKADLPAVTYQTVSAPSELDSDGVVDLVTGRFQITAVAATYKAAKTTARTITTVLNGYSGAMGTVTIAAVRIDGHHEDHEESTGLFTVAQDFTISFKE